MKKTAFCFALLVLISFLFVPEKFCQTDTDNDGIPDTWENQYGFNPAWATDAGFDNDNDLLITLEEYAINTHPLDNDTDNDGLSDYDEISLLGSEFQINMFIHDRQEEPSAASNGTNYLVAWESNTQDGNDDGVFARIYNQDGTAVGAEFQLYTYPTGFQGLPAIASDGTNYFVVWVNWLLRDTDKYRLYGTLLDAEGNIIGTEFPITSSTTSSQYTPSIASNGTNYLVTWRRWLNGNLDIYGQLCDNEGNAMGTAFRINTDIVFKHTSPSVTSNGTNYFVVWESDLQDGSGLGIYGQSFDNEGNALGTEFRVNTHTANDQTSPSVASDGTNYLVVWDSKGQDGSSYGIYGQFYDPTGNAIGAEFKVNAHTVSSQDSPSVTGNSEGYFVTWESDFQDGSSSGIYGQFYDPAGNTNGTEFQLTYTAFSQRSPAVASAGANYLAVWKSDFQDGSSYGIYGQRIKSFYGTSPLNPDMDGDGLKDGEEVHTYSTNQLNPDTDNDGMNDGAEVYAGMEPDNADSLFAITYCNYEKDIDEVMLQWKGSISHPNIPYKIFWRQDTLSPWQEVVTEPGDIQDNDGIRTWFDYGDNDSVSPRPMPANDTSRFYQVGVE